MKTADGFPIVCYGSDYKDGKTSHKICQKCDIYHRGKAHLTKPAYRLEGIHKSGHRTCPLFEPQNT